MKLTLGAAIQLGATTTVIPSPRTKPEERHHTIDKNKGRPARARK
jgi:hypothetical protein